MANMPLIEGLEPRLMLTTLVGGDVFEYQDAVDSEHIIRMVLDGNIIAEFIAADIDDNNNIILGDIPGLITDSTTGRSGAEILGGIGGADGIELIGSITGLDLAAEDINLQALASQDAQGNGATYAFNVVTIGETLTIQLVMLQPPATLQGDVPATVESQLQQASLYEDSMPDLDTAIGTINAFAVHPTTGMAYAVVEETGVSALYSINRGLGAVTPITANIAGGAIINIEAMEFDSTGSLYVIGKDATGTDATLGEIAPATGNLIGAAVTISDGTNNITSTYGSLAFDAADQLYAAEKAVDGTGAAVTNLHTINIISGVRTVIGIIQIGGDSPVATMIDGLAFTEDAAGNTILVGLDNAQVDGDTGATLPRLMSITLSTGTATPLCEPGKAIEAFGLSSYKEAGDARAMLFTAAETDPDLGTKAVIRGAVPSLPLSEGASTVITVPGADFRPRTGAAGDGLLYFVARYTPTGDGAQQTDRLYTIDTTKANTSAIQNTLTLVGDVNALDSTFVTSIAWEQNAGVATLYGYRYTDEAGQLIIIDEATGAGTTVTDITLLGEAVLDITGIEFSRDDPAAAEPYILAVQNAGSSSQLLRVNMTTGTCYVLGPLSDPDSPEGADAILGEDLQGIAWNPILRNPFTGEIGVLIVTDAETDELAFIDARPRFPTADIFAIYVAQASEGSSITISHVPGVEEEVRPMLPFEGNVGDVRINPANGDVTVISSPGGMGEVWIGAQTEDIDPDDDEEDLIPILIGNLAQSLGVRARNVDDFPLDVDNDLSAGVVVAESLLAYLQGAPLANQLLGMNLDDVQEIAVHRSDGTAVVVDIDRVDEMGAEIPGDQIAVVDTVTGLATDIANVVDAATKLPLYGIRGLDYGDHDPAAALNTGWMLGNQQLFAIYDIDDARPAADIGGDLGGDFNMVGLTVTVGDIMYAIDDRGGAGTNFDLYRIDRDATGAIVAPFAPALGEIRTPAGLVLDFNAIEANPFDGMLYAVGVDPVSGDQTLYTLAINPSDVDGDGFVDDILATEVGALDTGVLVAANTIKALAFTPDAATLYAVVDMGVGGDTLYVIDSTNGGATPAVPLPGDSSIQVGGVPTDIEGMDFARDGALYAIDKSGGARLIMIDVTTPTTSIALTAPGSVNGDLIGYASDREGLFYSINPMLPNPSPDQVWVSPGLAPTLGTIDDDPTSPTFGEFTQIGAVWDGGSGFALSAVSTMAFKNTSASIPSQQGLFVVDAANTLYEINPADGSIISAGYTLLDSGATAIGIDSMDFDQYNNLYGHDLSNGRLVDIGLFPLQPFGAPAGTITVGANTATTIGSLRPTLGAISYDTLNDRFLTVDNATGNMLLGAGEATALESSVMMELKGVTSTSATSQNMSKFMVAGAVTGNVNISGSIDTFYSGWLITGATGGQGEGGPLNPDNFYVGGDIRNLIVNSPIGTDGTYNDDKLDEPRYVTGFDLEVGGKAGQVWTLGNFIGAANFQNQPILDYHDPMGGMQYEVENRTTVANPEGVQFQAFSLFRTDGSYNNDSFDTAQYLGTTRNAVYGDPDEIAVYGVIQSDPIGDHLDYYAVSLMAGQTITVQLFDMVGLLDVGVFDPDGRLIATDRSNVDPGSTNDQPFRFTADRAGVYRFAVGGAPFDGSVAIEIAASYVMYIDAVGNLAAGAIVASNNTDNRSGNNIFSTTGSPMAGVLLGDMGAIIAGDKFYSETAIDVQVINGDIRAIVAGDIGRFDGDDVVDGITVYALNGSAGLFRATSSAGILWLYDVTLGGDMQIIDGANQVGFELTADGGLGVLRAGTMTIDNFASKIDLNVDGIGDDGIIDLIDVVGDMGTLNAGGPQITTGPNGNVRYIRVGGDVYPDVFFGGGAQIRTTLDPGQNDTIRDDSGGDIYIAPWAVTLDPITGEMIDPVTLQPLAPEDQPVLTYRSYGIRGSGGGVLIDVTSTGGLMINAYSFGVGAPVEIGRIEVNGAGRGIVVNPISGSLEMAPQPSGAYDTDLLVHIGSIGDTSLSHPIDVFEIQGGNFTSISNSTGGEIVNIIADSIGDLYSYGSIGLAPGRVGPAVNPIRDLVTDNAFVPEGFPFTQQHVGVVVNGHLIAVASNGGVGNFMVDGTIGTISANYSDAVDHADGQFDGINAPIFATGDMQGVIIGEGVAPSGSGSFAHSGLFASGQILYVANHDATNQGLGSDIRGDIVGVAGVRQISLVNGSIINADIYACSLDSSLEYTPVATTGMVEAIGLNGIGGIIGSDIGGISVGDINVVGGFGLFNSDIFSNTGNGEIGHTTVDGYGIRGVFFNGGRNQGNITATGLGALASTLDYSETVRYSQTYEYDPLFDQRVSRLNDIHWYLGTSLAAPNDRQGFIEDVRANGQGDLGIVSGYRIRSTGLAPSSFDFANSISGFQTYAIHVTDPLNRSIDNVEIMTGALRFFNPARDVFALDMNIAGLIYSVCINGSLLGGSHIRTWGPNGNINFVYVAGDMDGWITSSGIVGTVIIGGNMTSGVITIEPSLPVPYALGYLQIIGSYEGILDILGNVGTIYIGNNLGSVPAVPGQSIQINGNLNALYVGLLVAGSQMTLDVSVLGNLGVMYVSGQVDGDVFVGGNLSQLTVINAGGNFNGNVVVMGSLYAFSLNGGSLTSSVTAGNYLGSAYIIGGDLAVGASLVCSFGDITLVYIQGGDLLGTVSAPNGTIGSIMVFNSDLGAASLIEAGALNYLYLAGSILTGARVEIDNELGTLVVGQDIQAGSTVTVGSAGYVQVIRDLLGDFTLGYRQYGTTLYIGRNLGSAGSTLSVDADTTLTVLGDVQADSTISIGRDMPLLNVVGDILGDVLVAGAGGTIMANDITAAVITTGLDMRFLYATGNVTNTLVQTGISKGDDGTFGTADLNETSRMGKLSTLYVLGNVTDSIIAAGGDVYTAYILGNMTNSSISSGLSVGGMAVAAVIADPTPLANAVEQDAARSGADRMLLRGNFNYATVINMAGSDLTAGVDAGPDGAFGTADDTVVSSVTGGNSSFTVVSAATDAASNVIADDAIWFNAVTGAGTVTTALGAATFLNDITAGMGSALEPLVATATFGAPVVYNTLGFQVTITVFGAGQVDVHDNAGDDVVDSLVVRGANAGTLITVETTVGVPGNVDIGRILTDANTPVYSLSFDGDLIGDGVAASPDLWLDGPATIFSLGGFGDAANGQIGGDVTLMTLVTQGSGNLRVGGRVISLTITNGNDPLLVNMGAVAAGNTIETLAIDSLGNAWVYNSTTGQLQPATLATGALGAGVAVVDALDNTLTITGMDFDGAVPNLLYAVAPLYNLSPTQQIGAIAGTDVSLGALAVDANGRVLAVENPALVSIGTDTFGLSLSTQLGAGYDIRALTVTAAGQMYAVNNNAGALELYQVDRDADGAVTTVTLLGVIQDGVDNVTNIQAIDVSALGVVYVVGTTAPLAGDMALFTVSTTDAAATQIAALDGGGVLDNFVGLAFASDGATLYGVREVGATNQLYTINTATAVLALVGGGAIQIGGVDVAIWGMDVDAVGDFHAIDNTGAGTGRLIRIDTTAPNASVAMSAAGSVVDGVRGFASDANSTFYTIDSAAGDSPILQGNLVSVESLGASSIVGTTVTSAGQMYAVVQTVGRTLLYSVDRTGDVVTRFTLVCDINDGNTVTGISAIDADPTGLLYVVGTTPVLLGDMALFTVDTTTTATTLVANLTDPAPVADTIEALAFAADGVTLYAVRNAGGTHTLYTIDTATAVMTEVVGATLGNGEIQVINPAGANFATAIMGMDVDADGNFLAVDTGAGAGTGWTIRINVTDPGLSWNVDEANSVSANVDGYASDSAGSFYSTESTATQFEVLRSPGRDCLVEIDTTTGAKTVVGVIKDVFGNSYFNDVYALAFDAVGTLYGLLRDLDGVGGNQSVVDGAAMVAIATTATGGEVKATDPLNPFNPGVLLSDGAAITDEFHAMSVDAAGTIYAIRRGTGAFANQDHLVDITIVGITPALAGVSRVQVNFGGGPLDTNIIGMGFDSDGDIVAYNNDGVNANLINLSDPLTHAINPNNALPITIETALDVDIDAYALGQSGANYTAYAYDTGDVVGGMVYQNPGTVDTLGIVNTATGRFTQLRGLTETSVAGTPLSSPAVGLAVDNFLTGNVFIVTADGRLAEYDVATGQLVQYPDPGFVPVDAIATITDANSGAAINVTSIEFDDATGDLIGVDARFSQLVTLPLVNQFLIPILAGLTPATSIPRTESGSVNAADLADMACDPSPPTPGIFYSFNSSIGANGTFVQFRSTPPAPPTQADLGGIVLGSVNSLRILGGAGAYRGRVVATGNTFGYVSITGDFAGSLFTCGDISFFYQTGGNFYGSLYSGGNISTVYILNGSLLDGGSVEAAGYLGMLYVSGAGVGNFGGIVKARDAGYIYVGGDTQATAELRIDGRAGVVNFGGNFLGLGRFGVLGSLILAGQFGATADLAVTGDTSVVSIGNGLAAGGKMAISGYVSSLSLAGQLAGSVNIDKGLGAATIGSANAAFLVVGEDSGTLFVIGDVTNSVFSFGTTIGADGLYNTEDDVITGGSLNFAYFGGTFLDSAIVAGVLPTLAYGPGIPADMRAYTGNALAGDIADVDSAEAGGVLKSNITSVAIVGNTVNPVTLARSAVAAADYLGPVTLYTGGAVIWTRQYTDPLGPPSISAAGVSRISDDEVQLTFSEEINTSTFILAQDLDGDGLVTGLADVLGTVLIRNEDTGEVINDVQLAYTTTTDEAGRIHGVLRLIKADLFDGTQRISMELFGRLVPAGDLTPPTITGRSGLRSARVFVNSDMVGTILDGDDNHVPGGNFMFYVGGTYDLNADVPAYIWWFGCSPTSAGMLMGYYDGLDGGSVYGDLIAGDATLQTDDVNDAIASSGLNAVGLRADYICDAFGYHGTGPNGPAVLGTGHIGDYAIYDGIDDSGGLVEQDLSDPNLVEDLGVYPHADDCLADFIETSFSIQGLTMGGSRPWLIGPGMVDYAAYRGYTATFAEEVFDVGLTWETFVNEIDNGRPVMLGVDSAGMGFADHSIIGIGYNWQTNEYACYDTWSGAVAWYAFAPVGVPFGIASATFVNFA